jgi:hypothetical protein
MRQYRVGIIGLGKIAYYLPDNHLKAYEENPRTDVITTCDIDKSKGGKYTDYISMVQNEKLDIVSVCTPPETHCRIVCDIAPYVKAIYCEKPIATNLSDASKMINTCHEHKVILQINHQRLFVNPYFRFSRGVVNNGTHAFSLIKHLFRPEITVNVEYIDTDEHIFELDCTHNKEPMIKKGVEHLVQCLKEKKESISSGEKAFLALKSALQYEEYIRNMP